MIELKFQFANLAELHAFTAKLSPTSAPLPEIVPPAEAPPKPEKTSPKTKTEATAPAAPAATPAASPPTAAAAPTAAPASDPAEMTYEKSGLAQKISQAAAKDKPATVALLAKFGVAKGPMLKPDQFEAFGAEVDALLAGESLS